MKLEQQVVSLELARKLRELGVKQESIFYYFPYPSGSVRKEEHHMQFVHERNGYDLYQGEGFAAFTVAELGEMLPEYFESFRPQGVIGYRWVCYDARNEQRTREHWYADTEADARAKMLIYLIENKLVTL